MRGFHQIKCVLAWAVTLLVAVTSSSAQPCTEWIAGPMNGFAQGVNGRVKAVLSWDHDGFASTPPWVVVGGSFTTAGGIPANNIAAWDGQAWRAFGLGIVHSGNIATVHALMVHNGELIAGGFFDNAGGLPVSNVARWNGAMWQGFGIFTVTPPPVFAMTVYNGQITVAGVYDDNGTPGNYNDNMGVFTWNGTSWNFLDFGINGHVLALAVLDSKLYAGGGFGQIGGVLSNGIARWNGTSWEAIPGIGGGPGPLMVTTLTYNPVSNWLFVGGRFSTAGGQPVNNAAIYNGISWINMASGVGAGGADIVRASTVTADPNQRIVVVGTVGAEHVSVGWDGFAWQPIADDFNAEIYAVQFHDATPTVDDESLFFGGDFTSVSPPTGSITSSHTVQLTEIGQFVPMHHAPPIRAMAGTAVGFVAAGDFNYEIAPGAVAHNLIRWDGQQLLTVASNPGPGEGTNGPVYALETQSVGQFRHLYIGGLFSAAGGFSGVFANNVARYTTHIINITASFSALGPGFNNAVYAIELHNGQVYAGGLFTHSGGTVVNRVARWDGGSSTWQPLGQGLNGAVFALKSFDGELYAGGSFTFSGPSVMPRIARWNGSSWNPCTVQGMDSAVRALEAYNGSLIAGGAFTTAGGNSAKGVASWNGASWSAIGSGLDPMPGTGGAVNALIAGNNRLYAGGRFSFPFLNYTAEFDGSQWLSMQFRADGPVNALAFRNGELQAGGEFRSLAEPSGPVNTPVWARFLDYSQPMFAQSPISPLPACSGDDVAMSCALHPDYSGYTFRWRRNGIDLSNGPSPSGAFIAGATSPQLSIFGVRTADAGTYTCAVTFNGCSPGISSPATLTVANCCPPDINEDGAVNIADLLYLIGAWGPCGGCPADTNGDGLVNINDLLGVIGAWGSCP